MTAAPNGYGDWSGSERATIAEQIASLAFGGAEAIARATQKNLEKFIKVLPLLKILYKGFITKLKNHKF